VSRASREEITAARDAGPSTPGSRFPALVTRAVIEDVRPQIDGGRFPIKRTVGETVAVTAAIFADGHAALSAVLLHRPTSPQGGDDRAWRETAMHVASEGSDDWSGAFPVDDPGGHEYAVLAWVDPFKSWRHDLEIKASTGDDVRIELLEGSLLIREAASRPGPFGPGPFGPGPSEPGPSRPRNPDAEWLLARADLLTDDMLTIGERVSAALDDELSTLMEVYADRSRATMSRPLKIWADRERARFGAWYEFFPRSAGHHPGRSGNFSEASALLPRIADLGFDVVYLPPIHPIGSSYRKGANHALIAAPGDPGSPWAIGSAEGGHTAVHPALGTLDDFIRFREEAERLGMEVALDLAWQCSPDHPWVEEHPEWFRQRPDGTIKYAENPPKKYQDIYPLDFECEDWRALWRALLEVTRFWVACGVRIFRVDNPHTKNFGFWEWLIDAVHARHPDVLFLSEAFTRPRLMRYLAKVGFTQSYTYFTWRNTRDELIAYFAELTATDVREYLRPNLFANTPDILHAYLQHGGRPAFEARLLLAATLGANYGIYSGFELCENRGAGPASEEYADSEKYQIRVWDWDRPGNINELVARVNMIRHRHPALQYDTTLRFHATDNDQLIAYSKRAPDDSETLLVIVNLDPHHMQHGWVEAPDVDDDDRLYTVTDLLDDNAYGWRGRWNYVRLDPGVRQGHIFDLRRT